MGQAVTGKQRIGTNVTITTGAVNLAGYIQNTLNASMVLVKLWGGSGASASQAIVPRPSWDGATNSTGVSTGLTTDPTSGVAMNGTENASAQCIIIRNAVAGAPIPYPHLALEIQGHASTTVTGVNIDAWVFYRDDAGPRALP
jgi:hypothetical protein